MFAKFRHVCSPEHLVHSISYIRSAYHYIEFNAVGQKRVVRYWGYVYWGIVGSVVIGLVTLLGRCPNCGFDDGSMFAGVMATYVVIGLLQPLFWKKLLHRFNRPDGPVLGKHVTTLCENGIEDRGRGCLLFYEWVCVEEIAIDKTMLIIWVDTSVGIFIPRNAFATTADEAAFIAYANERIAASRAPAAN